MADEYIINVKANTKPAEAGVASFADNFSQAITGVNQGLELADKIVRKLRESFDKIIDTALLGESTDAVAKRFELLAKQAGQVPSAIVAGIREATDGTVSMDDAMQAAAKSFILLEEQSSKIPAIFEAARKSAQAFGGDTVENFNAISQAIATTNTRSLKEFGLVIDAGEAYKTYASHIGKTVESLSQAQRQEAISNAVLEKSNEAYKNINGSITPLNEALTKNKNAWNDLHESSAQLFNDTFGATITKITEKMTAFIEKWATLNSMARSNAIPQTSKEVEVLAEKLSRLAEMQVANPNLSGYYQKQIDEITERLRQFSIEEENSTRKVLDSTSTFNAKANAISAVKYSMDELRNAQQAYEAEIYASLSALDQLFYSIKVGFYESAKTIKEVGKQIGNTLVGGLTNGLAAMGGALATGGDAWSEFGKQALKAIGAICIQLGTMLMLSGLGFSVIPPYTGAPAIVAGAALIVLGGAIQAFAGGGVGSAAAASTASGGATPVTSMNNDMVAQPDEQDRAKAQTGIVVNVQGNILDRRETGLAIAEIINDAFDTNGVLIRANA